MVVEGLVLGGQEGIDDPLRDRLDRDEQTVLDGELRQQPAVAGMDPGGDRRLIVGKPAIGRKAAAEMVRHEQDSEAAQHDACGGKPEEEAQQTCHFTQKQTNIVAKSRPAAEGNAETTEGAAEMKRKNRLVIAAGRRPG